MNIVQIRAGIYDRMKSDKRSNPVVPLKTGEKTLRELLGLSDSDDNIFYTKIYPAQPSEEIEDFPFLVCFRDKTVYSEFTKRFFDYIFCINIFTNDPTMLTADQIEHRLYDLFHVQSFTREGELYLTRFEESEEFNEIDNGRYCTIISISVSSKEAMGVER